MNLRVNFRQTHLDEYCSFDFVNRVKESEQFDRFVRDLGMTTPKNEQKIVNLSGGNKQKVMIANCVAPRPRILIVDQRTCGIDVGAKAEVHALLSQLAEQGLSIIVIASDLSEVVAVCDRVLVIKAGQIAGELSRAVATQERVMLAATG